VRRHAGAFAGRSPGPVAVKRILVTGAAGAIGPAVVRALVANGLDVRAAVMRETDRRMLPASVDLVVGDLTSLPVVESSVRGVDGVVHLAGLAHRARIPAELADRYWAVNVDVTRQLVAAAQRHGTSRFVLASTIAVYQTGSNEPIVEDAVPRPPTIYGRTKLAAEGVVLMARRADGSPLGTVLRLAAVYGPRVKGNYHQLVLALARRRFVPIGRGDNHRTLDYVDDVARAVVLALAHPAAVGRIFNVCDRRSYSVEEIVGAICEALGRRPPRVAIPAGAARRGATIVEWAARLGGWETRVNRPAIDKYLEHADVSGRRLEEELGFRARTGLREGWREAVQAMRAAGELP
jgi:nucleoside-diphosphate-sugar epimerase